MTFDHELSLYACMDTAVMRNHVRWYTLTDIYPDV